AAPQARSLEPRERVAVELALEDLVAEAHAQGRERARHAGLGRAVRSQSLEVLDHELERDLAPAPRLPRAREVEEAAYVTPVGGEGVPREAGLDPQGLEEIGESARELVGIVRRGTPCELAAARVRLVGVRFVGGPGHAAPTLARRGPPG